MDIDRLDGILSTIAEGMLTPEFVTRLHLSKIAIERAASLKRRYDIADVARDLAVPFPVAHLLMNFMGAIMAEAQMVDVLARNESHRSEASH